MSRKKTKFTQRSNRLKKIGKRLAAYSAAAAATVVTSQDRSAEAAHVAWGIPDVSVSTAPGLLFNMVTGAATMATATSGNSTPGSMRLIGFYSASSPGAYVYTPAGSTLGAFVGSGSDVAFLASGDVIDSNRDFGATPYDNGNYGNLGNWSDGATGFVGIQFELSGATHYGWAEISRDIGATTATLHSFGYNNSAGDASIAGVPEPSSLMLLAAGAAGFGLWRKRKSNPAE